MAERIQVLYVGDDGAADAATALERKADRFDVVAETGATDGLDRLHDGEVSVDCVVSRYRLPDEDGFELLGAVREEYPRLPFVLVAEDCERAVVGEVVRVAGFARDVTDRKERERQLERERDRLDALFEAVPGAIVGVTLEDGEPTVRQINETFEEVFGYAEPEVVGESVDDLIVPDRLRDEAAEINREALGTGSIQREVRRTAADGERDFLFRTQKLQDCDGAELLGIYVDITEQKRREKQLQRQNERLDEYASLISHDLRNPLNVLMGALELAEETGGDEPFARCRRAVERMDRLIDDLLTLARQGDQVDQPERVDLGRIAGACWETTGTASADIEIEADCAVRADETRLRQLLENLFRNAVEHGPTSSRSETDDAAEHGGHDVTVTVSELADGFYVADDGSGIPEDEREQVFESGYSTSSDGTGFGLLIVRRIAEAHDWDVGVTESESGGARFEVTGVEIVE